MSNYCSIISSKAGTWFSTKLARRKRSWKVEITACKHYRRVHIHSIYVTHCASSSRKIDATANEKYKSARPVSLAPAILLLPPPPPPVSSGRFEPAHISAVSRTLSALLCLCDYSACVHYSALLEIFDVRFWRCDYRNATGIITPMLRYSALSSTL